jgi:hypothetical protein
VGLVVVERPQEPDEGLENFLFMLFAHGLSLLLMHPACCSLYALFE